MKILLSIFILLIQFSVSSQSLPIDFESSIFTEDFEDFDGGTATVIENPQSNGNNPSSRVARVVRNGGQIWAGSKISLEANLDFSSLSAISMKVFTTAPVGTVVKFKLEGAGSTERDVLTTVSEEWETLTWDFTGTPNDFNDIVFMFDFGNTGDGSETSTFLFDDIEQLYTGAQIDLPVDFENDMVNYTMSDFGGTYSLLDQDPLEASNAVMKVVKTDQATTWAGTTIGTAGGFASNIPLSFTEPKMSIKVWSPDEGISIRLKVENSNDPTQTCETEVTTTLSNEWEILEFDFINEADGTASLENGLTMGWTYNMASIFFNFGVEGSTVGEKTYYFDDVSFGNLVHTDDFTRSPDLKISPNPSNNYWQVSSQEERISSIFLYDLQGRKLMEIHPNSSAAQITATHLQSGLYIARIKTIFGEKIIKLIKS